MYPPVVHFSQSQARRRKHFPLHLQWSHPIVGRVQHNETVHETDDVLEGRMV